MKNSKSILISFPGYPYTPSSLMPDNGLANLAGSLMESGRQTLILDYGTIDSIKRFIPRSYSVILAEIYQAFKNNTKKGFAKSLNDLYLFLKLKIVSAALKKIQSKEVRKIGLDIAKLIETERPDFIGFKLWIGDGFTGSVSIAKIIKKRFPEIKIFAGGPLACLGEEAIYEITSVFDAICYGEGERTIVSLAEYVEGKRALEDVKNIFYKDRDRVLKTAAECVEVLNTLPLPVYDENVYPAMKGDQKIKVVVIDESRGCPFHCNFCTHSALNGVRWRTKSSDRIIKEIDRLVTRYNIHAFRYAGSSTPSKILKEVAEQITRQNIDVIYTSFAHVRSTDTNSMADMKKSGLCALFFGVESGDKRILDDIMGKGNDPAEIKRVLSASVESGIFTVGSILFPSPGETAESKARTLKLLQEIYTDPDSGAVPIQFPGIYPRTEWFNNPEKYGFKLKSKKTYKKTMASYKIKLLFPPHFWDPLPYTIDGKSHKEFSRETMDMIGELEKAGILTSMGDEIAMIGMLAGFSPREYGEHLRFNFYCGNWKELQEEAYVINRNITLNAEAREAIRSKPFGGYKKSVTDPEEKERIKDKHILSELKQMLKFLIIIITRAIV